MKTFLQKVLIIWLSAFTFFLVAPSLFHNGDNVYNSTVLESKNYNGYFPLPFENDLIQTGCFVYNQEENYYMYDTSLVNCQNQVFLYHSGYGVFELDESPYWYSGYFQRIIINDGYFQVSDAYNNIITGYLDGMVFLNGYSNYESEE